MRRAHFVFTQHRNSFSVKVKNLETLSVEQIQDIQNFVSTRKGLFDFDTYTFVVQKRLEFTDFVSLLRNTEIDAYCEESILQEKESKRIGFGQYKGMAYSELPDSYMLWLKTNYRGYEKENIAEELQKRNL